MKKITYIFALLALAACSNDDVVNTTTSNEIRLSVTANPISRALTHHESYRTDNINYFWLWANVNGSNPFQPYFTKQKVTKSTSYTSYWQLETPYYWPDGGSLDFWAYHNEATEGSAGTAAYNANGKLEVVGIELPVDAADQDDALYAYAKQQQKTTDSNVVSLNMRHALSMMEFRAENKSENVVVEVKKVTVTGLRQKGSFYIDDTTPTQYLFDINEDNSSASNSSDTGGSTEGKYYPYSTDIHWFANYGEETLKITNSGVTEQVPIHNQEGKFADQYCYTVDGGSSYMTILPKAKSTDDGTHVKTTNTSNPVIGKMLVLPLAMTQLGNPYKNMKIKVLCRIYSVVDMDGFMEKYNALSNPTPEDVHTLLTQTETKDGVTTNKYASAIYEKTGEDFASGDFREFYVDLPAVEAYYINKNLDNKGNEQSDVTDRFVPGIRYVYKFVFGGDDSTAKTDDDKELMYRVRVTPSIDYWPSGTDINSTTNL